MELDNLFNPRVVAVIGASRNPEKVGNVLLKNLIESKTSREIIPINPNAKMILGKKSYPSVIDVKEKIDLAIIAIPADLVLTVLEDCGKKQIRNVIIISSGFSEIGKKDLEMKIKNFLVTNKMHAIGVNCLGVYDAYSSFNALFIPKTRMDLPEKGGISFVCQSGAIGLAIMDIAAEKGYKFSKFISYGNATQLDESDFLEYLAEDKNTKVICMYIEGVKNGEKFFETAKRISSKKPVIVVKGGISNSGNEATLTHTGTLAGTKEVYYGIFDQTNLINADNLEQMFNIASILEDESKIVGNRIQIITNGGGYGIISTDYISESKNLKLSEMAEKTKNELRKKMPDYVSIRNPLDISGDATSERYKEALNIISVDPTIDMILLIVLYQTPLITTDIVNIITKAKDHTKKPIFVVSTGSEFTEKLSEKLIKHKIPVFSFPHSIIYALDKITKYKERLKKK